MISTMNMNAENTGPGQWKWRVNVPYWCLELFDEEDRMMAVVRPRPGYCDRGHWQVLLDPYASLASDLELDEADGRDLMYYMSLEAAMWETVEFLAWRLRRETRYDPGPVAIKDFVDEEMPGKVLWITSIEYRSTMAPHAGEEEA